MLGYSSFHIHLSLLVHLVFDSNTVRCRESLGKRSIPRFVVDLLIFSRMSIAMRNQLIILKELEEDRGIYAISNDALASCGPYRGESTFLFTPCIRSFPLGRETMTRIPSGIDCPPAWKTFDARTTYADRKYPRGCTRPRHDPVAEVRHTECKFASIELFALREDKIDTLFRRVLSHSRVANCVTLNRAFEGGIKK